MEVSLSHVCQRWRDVAISNPSLWSRIEARADPALVDRVKPRLEGYLSRSKSRLIDVLLFATVDSNGDPCEDYQWGEKLFKVVVRHSERWRSFTLHIPYVYSRDGWSGEDLVAILRNVSVPQLQVLDVYVDRPDDLSGKDGPQIFLQTAPRLSKLNIVAMGAFWHFLSMDTITTLTVQAYNAPIPFLQFLSLPQLRHLVITRKKGWSNTPIEADIDDSENWPLQGLHNVVLHPQQKYPLTAGALKSKQRYVR